MNQHSAVTLPVFSESQRFIWVPSDQIDLQLDCAAELDKAFNRFPYLTQKQTAALAQCCFLHPDQVKVWFMVQRLRYGISWDYKDIQEVRRKFKSKEVKAQQKEELRKSMGGVVKQGRRGKKGQKSVVKKSGGKKTEKARKGWSAKDGRVMGQNVRAAVQLERKKKQEPPTIKERDRKVEKVEEDKKKKQKRMALTEDQIRKRRMKQDVDGIMAQAGEVEIRSDKVEREGQRTNQSETTLSTREKKKAKANKGLMLVQEWPAHTRFVVPDKPLDVNPLVFLQSQTQTINLPPLSISQTEPLKRVDVILPATPNTGVTPMTSGYEADPERDAWLQACMHPTLTSGKTKRQTELAIMKWIFPHCQYPTREEYEFLATLMRIPHQLVMKWFSCTRYYLRKRKPRWMNEEQYRQALANITYRQYLAAQAKAQWREAGLTGEKGKRKFERSECCDKDENVKGFFQNRNDVASADLLTPH